MSKTKNVIVTGTSRGIGLELVPLFAAEGHRVLALSRNTKPVEALAHNNVSCFPFDISKASSFDMVSAFLKDHQWKQVDILINNAGQLVCKPFPETVPGDFETIYRVNVFGVAELIKTVLPFMSGDGHVVNISSMGGVQGSVKFPGLAAYSSAKGALNILTELLAEEYKATGPAFNALALGAVQTEMLEEAFPGYKAPVSAGDMARYIFNFSLEGRRFYNGKVLQVSVGTP